MKRKVPPQERGWQVTAEDGEHTQAEALARSQSENTQEEGMFWL